MGENRRALLLGVGGVVLVVAFLLVRVLGGGGGGGSNDADLTAPPIGPGGVPSAATTTTTGPQATETFEVFTARNPFRPLVSAAGAGGGTTVGGGGTGGSTGGGSTSGGTSGGGTTATTVNNTGSGGTAEPGSGQHVALLEIFTDNGQRTARVRVGSTVYTAKVGERFATNYQVTSLGDRCGDFLFGDSPFSLCVGEEIVK